MIHRHPLRLGVLAHRPQVLQQLPVHLLSRQHVLLRPLHIESEGVDFMLIALGYQPASLVRSSGDILLAQRLLDHLVLGLELDVLPLKSAERVP